MESDDLIRVRHMHEAAQDAVSFATGRTRTDLDHDRMLTFALMKAIEIIGEAAAKIAPNSREEFGDIPWQKITEFFS